MVDFNSNFETGAEEDFEMSEENPYNNDFSDIKHILDKQHPVEKFEDMFTLMPEWIVYVDPAKFEQQPTTYCTLVQGNSDSNQTDKENKCENIDANNNRKKRNKQKNKSVKIKDENNWKSNSKPIKRQEVTKKSVLPRIPFKEKNICNIYPVENLDIETASSNIEGSSYEDLQVDIINDSTSSTETEESNKFDEDYAPPLRRARVRAWRLKPKTQEISVSISEDSQIEKLKEKYNMLTYSSKKKSQWNKKIVKNWPKIILTILKPNYHFKSYFIESLCIGDDLKFFNERKSNIRKSSRNKKTLFKNLWEDKLSLNEKWFELNWETRRRQLRSSSKSKN